jgi:5-methylcytosine-specific restriction endonuclease McrBC regulatory subunit McrC
MLDPLAHATRLITQAARLLESEKLPDEVFELDAFAHRLAEIHAKREAAHDAKIARLNAEFEAYEATTGRDFDAWAQTASVGEIEQRMGLA